jgi:serine/threonine protein kinase
MLAPNSASVARRLPDATGASFAGRILGNKYRIERPIARGGMGSIYLATQALLGRPVALKVVRADAETDPQIQTIRRFVQEARMLGRLQHPNVVTVFDFGRVEDAAVETYFIAMEYLAGQTLAEYVASRGPLRAPETISILTQIARGLRAAHAQGIVHRDLKPSNILLVKSGDGDLIKIVDFGVGKDCFTDEALTLAGAVIGPPRFMSPEQFSGMSSPASDVYALGVIANLLLTGATPFLSTRLQDLLSEKLRRPLRSIGEQAPHVCVLPSLERLIYEMLALRPEHRPVIDDVLDELAACARDSEDTRGTAVQRGDDPSLDVTRPETRVTPLPDSRSNREEVREASVPKASTPKRSLPKAAQVFAALSVIASLVVYLVGRHALGARVTTSVTTTSASIPNDIATEERLTEARTRFVLHLETVPPGAWVSEDGRRLGITPLSVSIERASVAGDDLRAFLLEKDGFLPQFYAQTDSDSDVSASIPLRASPSSVPSASNSNGGPGASGKKSRANVSGASDRGIHLQR